MLVCSTIPHRCVMFQGQDSRYGSFGQRHAQTVNASLQHTALIGDLGTSMGGPCTYSIDTEYSHIRLTHYLSVVIDASNQSKTKDIES